MGNKQGTYQREAVSGTDLRVGDVLLFVGAQGLTLGSCHQVLTNPSS
jgi:hypothetical protein